ncbi:MAG TPA: substrate-binding domain-containing protein [Magnetospirillaceae bacterium]
MSITGLGPHGEKAAAPERLILTEAEADAARARRFTVAVVLHTMASDWAKQQLAGIVATLGRFAAVVVEVVDCGFNIKAQVEALDRLSRERPDAVISIPIANAAVAEAHRNVSHAGIKLVLLDNAPTGLLPGTDYATLVSADNFGLGQIAASLLSPHLLVGGIVGILAYGVDFFVTNEREIAFRKWMGNERPDLVIKHAKFAAVERAAQAIETLLIAQPKLSGLFVVWDEPAMHAVPVLRQFARPLPMTTIDLGNAAAIELASGQILKGIGAQQPYDQGTAVAMATVIALIGREPPPWVALPGLSVSTKDVIEAYQVIWHAPAPSELIKAWRDTAAR